MGSASGRYADLHVHTWYSDSSLSPAQAVEEAVRHGVGVLAIADHEGFEGSREAQALALARGIDFVPGAELECTEQGVQLHILCYGARWGDGALTDLAAHSRAVLDRMSVDLIGKMRGDYPALSLDEYEHFSYDRALGGWKGLHYLVHKGVTPTIKEGMRLYGIWGVGYERAGFPGLDALLTAIHGAGGKAVLAHPGHTLRHMSPEEMEGRLTQFIRRGLDGLECYYPLHREDATRMFVDLCNRHSLLITAGSDCHGTFGKTAVGQMDIDRSLLRLGDLL